MTISKNSFPAGIFKAHGRTVVGYAFFRWRRRKHDHAIEWIKQIGASGKLTSMVKQAEDTLTYDRGKGPSSLLTSFGLSYFGMKYLGLDRQYKEVLTKEPLLGTRVKYDNGNDPDYVAEIHKAYGFIMVAGTTEAEVTLELEKIRGLAHHSLFKGWTTQLGKTLKRAVGSTSHQIDPFGFREAISMPTQPEIRANIPVSDPMFPDAQGSIMSFLKLRTNKEEFNNLVDYIARNLHDLPEFTVPTAAQRKEAAALLMGRDFAGVPLAKDSTGAPITHLTNAFNYKEDAVGKLCPFASHIRVVNPRDPTRHPLPRIIRRGVAFNEDGMEGLLFISFQKDFTALTEMYDRIKEEKDYLLYAAPKAAQRAGRYHDRIITGNKKQVPIPLELLNLVSLLGENYFYVPPINFCAEIEAIMAA